MGTTDRHWLRDNRGVVAVSGLAMAVFMTAVLYYEIGVGDAITFKEQLQDASDASGFAAAVYHAKGMNMIVLLNLIMAAVLAIIVILRVLEMLFGIVAALVPAICWIPGFEWLCPLEGIADAGETWAQSANEAMDPIVHTALKGLNDVSTAVAVGMPWVALIKSGTVGVQYYPQVTSQKGGGTIMLSMSLMPDISWIPAVSNANNAGKSSMNGGLGLPGEEGTNIDGKRWGLPVQEGEFNVLCTQAAQVVPDLIEWAINAAVHGPTSDPPPWLTWLNKTIGSLIGSFPQYFCDEGAMTAGADTATGDIEKAAETQCDADETTWNQCKTELTGASGLPTPPEHRRQPRHLPTRDARRRRDEHGRAAAARRPTRATTASPSRCSRALQERQEPELRQGQMHQRREDEAEHGGFQAAVVTRFDPPEGHLQLRGERQRLPVDLVVRLGRLPEPGRARRERRPLVEERRHGRKPAAHDDAHEGGVLLLGGEPVQQAEGGQDQGTKGSGVLCGTAAQHALLG